MAQRRRVPEQSVGAPIGTDLREGITDVSIVGSLPAMAPRAAVVSLVMINRRRRSSSLTPEFRRVHPCAAPVRSSWRRVCHPLQG